MHYRNLEKDKIKNLNNSDNYDLEMYISNASKTEMIWWSHNVRTLNGKPIRPYPVQFWIETDVSLDGWGACLDDKTSGGRWTNVESTCHINFLELLSIFNALKALCANSNKCHIGITSDNSTAVSYINNMGGMTSEALDELTCKIWLWGLERDIFISAQHIPGDTNVQADTLS